jgi:uncharacterized protein involved in cysteine biosynthesis
MGDVVKFPHRQSDAAAWMALALSIPMIAAMLPVIAAGAMARAWLAAVDESQYRREEENAHRYR